MFVKGIDWTSPFKRCSKCNEYFPRTVEFFARHPISKDGLKPRCKRCHADDAIQHYRKRPDKETVKRHAKEWAAKHPEKHKESHRRSRKKSLKNPVRRIAMRFANLMGMCLKQRGYKARKGWAVPYTPEQLVEHLSKQFKPGMSWSNYGQWQIDHIRPRVIFDYKSPNDASFLECWRLENIQPLWAEENLKKGKSWDS